jgi:hypothetical protein
VDLLACGAQDRGVDGIDIGAAQRFGFLDEAAQRLVRGIEGATEFVMNPGQGTEVV